MKELLKNLDMIPPEKAIGCTLIDTCAFIHVFEHHEKIIDFKTSLKNDRYAMTSFNIEELMHVEHKLGKKVKESIRVVEDLNLHTGMTPEDINKDLELDSPRIFFIGTNHDEFKKYNFPEGSIVLDPWRMIRDQQGVKVIGIGIGK